MATINDTIQDPNILDADVLEQDTQPIEATPTVQDISEDFLLQEAQTAARQAESNISSIRSELSPIRQEAAAITEQLGEKESFVRGEQERFGVVDTTGQLADIQAQIASRNAIAQADVLEKAGTGRGIPQAVVARQQQAVKRDAAIDVLRLSATANILRGNLAAAEAQIQRSVDAKFSPLEKELEAKISNIEAIEERLTGAEKARAEAQKQLLQERRNVLKGRKDQENEAQKLALELAKNGAPNTIIARATKAESPQDVLAIEGANRYLTSRADRLREQKLSFEVQEAADKKRRLEEQVQSGQVVIPDSVKGEAFKLIDRYEKESGTFKSQVESFNRVVASKEDPSAAGDIALIFNYMKLLDPGSVVREGEFATAQNAAGIPTRIMASYNRALKGQRLTEVQRDDFFDRAGKIYSTALDQQRKLDDQFVERSNQFGVPPEAVIRDLTSVKEQETVALTAKSNEDLLSSLDETIDQPTGASITTPREFFNLLEAN